MTHNSYPPAKDQTEHSDVLDAESLQNNMNEARVQHILKNMLSNMPAFAITGNPVPLSGGLLNYVWRIQGREGSVPSTLIAKWAPPFVACSPNVQLDPNRIIIEANALKAFSPGNVLAAIATDSIKLPILYALDAENHVILMEDLGESPDLETWIGEIHTKQEAIQLGKILGDFISNLHKISSQLPDLATIFDNPNIQRTRLEVLYGNIFNYATRANIPDASDLAERAMAFGEELQLPGRTVIMGDLWPRSVIVSDDKLRIIDWELAHYGKPAQDVGHFAAHMWMLAHRASSAFITENINAMLKAFLVAYKEGLGSDFEKVLGNEGVDESSIHFGCEILARSVGLFQVGYVYDGLAVDHPAIVQAVEVAAEHIRGTSNSRIFEILL